MKKKDAIEQDAGMNETLEEYVDLIEEITNYYDNPEKIKLTLAEFFGIMRFAYEKYIYQRK